MTQIAGPTLPALNGVLIGKMMLQNLPSALVAHILDPQKGDVILDMCSCPGGKTSHIASLIGNDGLVIACDKGKKKMIEARDFFKSMNATCIVPISTDSTKLFLPVDKQNKLTPKDIVDAATFENNDDLLQIEGFNPGSFDRILLDPPCSALGLRPKLQVDIKTSEELWKHADYQKQFVRCAVPLLKNGGIMTYSTCTINASENEEMVKFIITEFPCMKLLPISEEFPGLPGLPGVGLSEEECKMVRRFDPCNKTIDSMGFFIAKFQKL
jgi:16S rRNA C967 or C1407 C5-methylase (RsmB/RsmF family)